MDRNNLRLRRGFPKTAVISSTVPIFGKEMVGTPGCRTQILAKIIPVICLPRKNVHLMSNKKFKSKHELAA